MAANLSATHDVGRSTFLLEVALDRARMKQRLAAALLAQRVERGGGDARRFPQPAMAQLLGYSLRQYQRLEDPDDPNLPTWNNIEAISAKLNLNASAIFGEDEPVEEPPAPATPPSDDLLFQKVEALETAVEALRTEIREALGLPSTRRAAS